MTIWNIARACKGHLAVPAGKHTGTCPAAGMAVIRGYSGKEAAGIVIDSRKVEPGDIFVAIRGERVDGHQFIREVFDKGAIAVVCEEEPEELPGPCIRVEDSLAALRQIAAFYREQMPIPIVGITGSVGKTSTKEFVASVLAQKYKTHKTQGNFNTACHAGGYGGCRCGDGHQSFRGDAPFKRDGKAGYLRDDKYRSVPSGIPRKPGWYFEGKIRDF